MFIVAQVMSSSECLSIVTRSELGSDLDCSVINSRPELGSDLDCYELMIPNVIQSLFFCLYFLNFTFFMVRDVEFWLYVWCCG